MERYFFGDSLKAWVICLWLFAVLPIGLSAALGLVANGYDHRLEFQLKALGIALMAAFIFMVVARVKSQPLSKRKVKHLAKPGRKP
jgi:hypothetical protein